MKNKIFIIFILSALLSGACSEKLLDVSDENNYNAETFFKDAKSVTESANAAYSVLLHPGMFIREYYFIFDLFGNDADKNTPLQGSLLDFPSYAHTPVTTELNYFFISNYKMILRANFAIEAITKWAPTVAGDVALATRLTGEMEFLKSYANFLLVTCYGDVPLKKTLADCFIADAERTPKAEVWAYIESTLQSAITKLPVSYGTADYGRITKGAAVALLGKSYLYQKKYTEALAQFTLLQSAPYNYGLTTSLDDMFVNDLKTRETIFSVMHAEWQGAGVGNSRIMLGQRVETVAGGKATHTGRAMEYGFADFWNCLVSPALVGAFTYNNESGVSTIDPRARLTFYDNLGVVGGVGSSGGDGIYCDVCPTGTKNYASAVGTVKKIISWRKYEHYESIAKYGNPMSYINTQVIRYADVLLMMAECHIQKATPDLPAALTLINLVRARSGAFQYTTLGTQANAFTLLMRERQLELAGEQVRFHDLVRWNLLETVINDEKFAANGTRPVRPYHVLFPIPQSEKDANPKLAAQVKDNWN